MYTKALKLGRDLRAFKEFMLPQGVRFSFSPMAFVVGTLVTFGPYLLVGCERALAQVDTVYVTGSVDGASKFKARKALVLSGNKEIVFECGRVKMNRKGNLANAGPKTYVIGKEPKGMTELIDAEAIFYKDEKALVTKCVRKVAKEHGKGFENF